MRYQERPERFEYRLTEKGRDLYRSWPRCWPGATGGRRPRRVRPCASCTVRAATPSIRSWPARTAALPRVCATCSRWSTARPPDAANGTALDHHASGRAAVPSRDRLEACHPPCRTRPPGAHRSRPSATTPSCPTARRSRWSRPAATSSGCACPGWTRRASSARSSTATPATSASARRPQRPGGPPLPPGHDGPGDELGHAERLDHRSRRPAHGAVAPRGRALEDAPPRADRLRRRARAAAHRPLRQRRGAGRHGLRADVRLRTPPGRVGLQRRGLPAGRRPRPGARPRAHADHRPPHRLRGWPRDGPHAAQGGRVPLLRAVVERAPAAEDLRGGLRPARVDRAPLAALAGPRPVPRPSLAGLPAAQRADAEGADLRPHRGARGRGHDLAAGDARRPAQLGLPLQLGPRRDLRAVGALHPRLRLGGQRLLLVHRRRGRAGQGAAGPVRRRRRAELPEQELDLEGYEGARPVRVGNAAYQQRQHDVWGAVLDSVYLHTKSRDRLDERIWPILVQQVESALAALARAGPGHLGGARRAAALHVVEAHVLGGGRPRRPPGPPEGRGRAGQEWQKRAEEIQADICAHGVDERGVFTQRYGAPALDASLLLMPLVRFLPADDPRMRGDGAGHRGRAHRRRSGAALPGGGDRRRPRDRGGRVPRSARSGWSPRSPRSATRSGPGRCARSCCRSPARSSSTPRRSTPAAAATSATSRRPSPTSR